MRESLRRMMKVEYQCVAINAVAAMFNVAIGLWDMWVHSYWWVLAFIVAFASAAIAHRYWCEARITQAVLKFLDGVDPR